MYLYLQEYCSKLFPFYIHNFTFNCCRKTWWGEIDPTAFQVSGNIWSSCDSPDVCENTQTHVGRAFPWFRRVGGGVWPAFSMSGTAPLFTSPSPDRSRLPPGSKVTQAWPRRTSDAPAFLSAWRSPQGIASFWNTSYKKYFYWQEQIFQVAVWFS